jgi:hypothetical protein
MRLLAHVSRRGRVGKPVIGMAASHPAHAALRGVVPRIVRKGWNGRSRQSGQGRSPNTADQRLLSVYMASTSSRSTPTLEGASLALPATHHCAPGRPEEA